MEEVWSLKVKQSEETMTNDQSQNGRYQIDEISHANSMGYSKYVHVGTGKEGKEGLKYRS